MKFILLLSFTFFSNSVPAIAIPASKTSNSFINLTSTPSSFLTSVAALKIKDIEKIIGRKLKLKEKIGIKIYQWKIKNELKYPKEQTKKNKGKTALLFGIAGLALLLLPVPFVGLLGSVIFTVLALVMGYSAKKENPNDRNAKTAIILGWVTTGLFVAALIVAVVILSGISWGWG